jgi:feruloyl-CoA synthase
MTGTTIKLIPDADLRCEIRVKGPNVMLGYFNTREKTAEAFDEEGYFITGDAMKFVDPEDMKRGLRFDGRISDEFKLLSGTWVRAAAIRNDLLACLAPLAADAVVTGQDRNDIGALVFPNRDAMAEAGFADSAENGIMTCAKLRKELGRRLCERAQQHFSSSTRIARAMFLEVQPSLAQGELTAKGNLNFRNVLTRRAALLERLYDDTAAVVVRV